MEGVVSGDGRQANRRSGLGALLGYAAEAAVGGRRGCAEPATSRWDAAVSDMILDVRRRRLSVAGYHGMAEAGAFQPDERVELIRGDLISVAPTGTEHRAAINRLNMLLTERFNGRAVVQVQCPVIMSDDSPEPEFALLEWDPTG